MARPRKFDEQTVLSGAMLVFWQKGYAATSTEDLEQATLIRRGSLYNAYTDKRTLFFKALEHYGHKEITEVVSIMTSAKSLVTGYQQVLDKAIAHASTDDSTSRGCLLCDAASELGGKDKLVAEKVNELFTPMADVFLKHFSSAKKQHSDDELTAKADAIMAGYMGFRLMCKLGYSTARLQALAKENAKQLTV
ncbi:MAG: TetR/AcrR family transcriptional regulator [Paraglaciecola polaris]|uniref:TetR/AcrR family transcriptional regulator n=1 Tax=Paraglaciecola polaris TaxID=222814 RepID=UPI0030028F00|tara:strand:- start:34 stop:612 length:579 start_codon:yes stop_codon:yes gene_type:complete